MQSSLTFNDNGILIDFVSFHIYADLQDNCFGFLYDDCLEQYSRTLFLLPCDSRDYIDVNQESHNEPLPFPGEFPLVDLHPGGTSGTKAILTEPSFGALSALSEDELSHWWGINLKYSEHPPVRNDFPDIAVSIGSGLSHFRDIITVAEEEQQSVGLDVPLVCPMSCMYHFFFFIQYYFTSTYLL